MSEAMKREIHTQEYKAKVGLEALRSRKTNNQIGQEFDVHPVQVGLWKKAIEEQAKTLVKVAWPQPSTPLIADLQVDNGQDRITSTRLWNVTKRFFQTTADAIESESPKTAEKLRRASPHWMRHTHATHALARGAELTTVRDNFRHASVSTTSVYLHTDQAKRARQMREAFGSPNA